MLGKAMNLAIRMARSKVASLGRHHHISIDQSLSRDSTIREEEIFLMDYVDGTFEVWMEGGPTMHTISCFHISEQHCLEIRGEAK